MSDQKKRPEDLTRIEEMDEFLHQDKTGVNHQLDFGNTSSQEQVEEEKSELEDFDPDAQTDPNLGDRIEKSNFYDENKSNDLEIESNEEDPFFSSEETASTDPFESEGVTDQEQFSADSPADNDDPFSNDSSDFSENNEDDFNQNQLDFEDTHSDFSSESDEKDGTFTQAMEQNKSSIDDELDSKNQDNPDILSDLEQNVQPPVSDQTKEQSEKGPNQIPAAPPISQIQTQQHSPTPPPSSKDFPPGIPVAPTSNDNSIKFEDVQRFGQVFTYGKIDGVISPAYSISLTKIKYQEDADDILIILKEHGICDLQNEKQITEGLSRGAILIAQISEYAAIFLANKLRRFDLKMMMGLAQEIHVTDSYENHQFIPISKSQFQNPQSVYGVRASKITLDEVILTTSDTIEHYSIQSYLGICSEFTLISNQQLKQNSSLIRELEEINNHGHSIGQTFSLSPLGLKKSLHQMTSIQYPHLFDIYHDLGQRLRPKAVASGGNGVIGIKFSVVPITDDENTQIEKTFKITCTGNIVHATRQAAISPN